MLHRLCAMAVLLLGSSSDERGEFDHSIAHIEGRKHADDKRMLPQFALCLSGELRTFAATARRFRNFVAANPGTDTFGFIGFVRPTAKSAKTPSPGANVTEKNMLGLQRRLSTLASAAAMAAAESAAAEWPGSVRLSNRSCQ